jgi:hypothetical protein
MHNAFVTEGSQPGIEIARSLGDLSHNVYTPAEGAGSLSDAKPGELLFIDYWADPNGMETFFSNRFAQEAGNRLYSSREESEWTPAPAAFTFQVPAPAGAPARFIGMMRAPVRSPDDAIVVLGKLVSMNLGAARRRGQLSHALFMRLADVVERQASVEHPPRRWGERCSAERAGGDPRRRLLADARRTQRALRRRDSDERARGCLGRTTGSVGLGAGEWLLRMVTHAKVNIPFLLHLFPRVRGR